MKLLAFCVLSTLAVAVHSGFPKEDDVETFRTTVLIPCQKVSGATDADIEHLLKHEVAERIEGKCLRACIIKMFNVMNANGKFDKNVALEYAKIHTKGDKAKLNLVEEVLDACVGLNVSDDHCVAAEEYWVCFKAESNKRGITTYDM